MTGDHHAQNCFGPTVPLKITGVMSSGESVFEGIMESELVPAIMYMPITTVQQVYPNSEKLSSIDVTLVDKDKLREVEEGSLITWK